MKLMIAGGTLGLALLLAVLFELHLTSKPIDTRVAATAVSPDGGHVLPYAATTPMRLGLAAVPDVGHPLAHASSLLVPGVTRTQPKVVLPLVLPHSPEIDSIVAGMEAQGDPDVRQEYNYLLGLYAHLDNCAGPTVETGSVTVMLHWLLDNEHIAHSDGPSIRKTDLDPTALETVQRCMETYLQSHDLEMPGRPLEPPREFTIGNEITFPISDQHIYKLIREATSPTR